MVQSASGPNRRQHVGEIVTPASLDGMAHAGRLLREFDQSEMVRAQERLYLELLHAKGIA